MILGANLRNIVFEPKKGSSLFLSLFIRDSKNKTLDQQKLLVVFQILVLGKHQSVITLEKRHKINNIYTHMYYRCVLTESWLN